jgi:hypothetical protein
MLVRFVLFRTRVFVDEAYRHNLIADFTARAEVSHWIGKVYVSYSLVEGESHSARETLRHWRTHHSGQWTRRSRIDREKQRPRSLQGPLERAVSQK